ncbi:esterase [Pseudomonas asuensis]|jgi:pimeloyl-ACP methyl ester carboxylesterase|uniref:Esterase n=1 Tax=Pseudomonas asuensis TaxID=1825787 RepID=A0ABQ2H354_9PSED|nr:alpha/beta fold hydrolase [Pseudomonas asuensis]GGM27248.1 esterase [Pseudomonas asuensis]
MQSSSQLFPVALVRAELYGDLIEDVYLLKPNNSPDHSVELSLTRLGRLHQQTPYRPPVILVHGAFGNRFTWYAPRGSGLGIELVDAGFDVWIAEMRGHGCSPRNLEYRNNQLSDYAHHDLPAIAAFVEEQSGLASHWIGHGQGGLAVILGLLNEWLTERSVRSLGLLGVAASDRLWSLLSWREKMRAIISGCGVGVGPEDEPKALLKGLQEERIFGKDRSEREHLLSRLSSLSMPVLSLAATNDPQVNAEACQALFNRFGAQQKEFISLGHALSREAVMSYGSPFMAREAHQHFSGLITQWLKAIENTSQGQDVAPSIELIE